MPNRSAKMKTLVKICGLRSIDDAMRATELGADAVGFVVAPASPRHISFQDSLAIAQHVLASVTPVLVLRHWSDVPPQELLLWPGPVQVYEFVGGPDRKRILGCSIEELNQLQECPNELITALLVDAPNAGAGEGWNWQRPKPPWTSQLPLILAGGLSPENVATAISQACPWAVDVSSGVESSRGVKDFKKVKDFIQNAQGAQKNIDASAKNASTILFNQL